ncbi:hypothetical protein LVY72_04840 [Arthrobacter sp. I2-34]|uniref:Uncharacterized protein n=1 Tax=Arthrobacter hankyongi TaxID=2904801 RepID=A0ABS9L420_9MICC|nr:hypothetical protein [Arthrobacter hankyongi]MCG2621239.1 hypothetical protein [Arthrobacter hankyongi]
MNLSENQRCRWERDLGLAEADLDYTAAMLDHLDCRLRGVHTGEIDDHIQIEISELFGREESVLDTGSLGGLKRRIRYIGCKDFAAGEDRDADM